MIIIWSIVALVTVLFLGVVFVGAPYVPSHQGPVRSAFQELRPLSKHDVVADLGSGDGTVLLEALKAGAGTVIGYELNPVLVGISRLRVGSRGIVQLANIWQVQLPSTVSVVYIFGVKRDMQRYEARLQQWVNKHKKPLDVITYGDGLPGLRPQAVQGAHALYRINPLQSDKP